MLFNTFIFMRKSQKVNDFRSSGEPRKIDRKSGSCSKGFYRMPANHYSTAPVRIQKAC